jgi:hypothetical protein
MFCLGHGPWRSYPHQPAVVFNKSINYPRPFPIRNPVLPMFTAGVTLTNPIPNLFSSHNRAHRPRGSSGISTIPSVGLNCAGAGFIPNVSLVLVSPTRDAALIFELL